jgi:hypothetical protein
MRVLAHCCKVTATWKPACCSLERIVSAPKVHAICEVWMLSHTRPACASTRESAKYSHTAHIGHYRRTLASRSRVLVGADRDGPHVDDCCRVAAPVQHLQQQRTAIRVAECAPRQACPQRSQAATAGSVRHCPFRLSQISWGGRWVRLFISVWLQSSAGGSTAGPQLHGGTGPPTCCGWYSPRYTAEPCTTSRVGMNMSVTPMLHVGR